MHKPILLFALALLAPLAPGHAQTLSRGPYLQNSNTSAISLRWRTSTATDSVVRYGLTAGSLTQTASVAGSRTEHEVRITGLTADTRYFYSVGNTAGAIAGDSSYLFVTAPTTAKPTRVWVIGDAGLGSTGQLQVRDAYANFTGTRHTDLWLMLGDNAYADGTDAEYQAKLFNVYGSMLRKSALWSTYGNHDGHSADSASQSGPYYDMHTFPKSGEAGGVASGTEAYYSWDYGNVHFISLDSYESSRSSTGTQANWLRNDLAANTKDWTIVIFHHPPYTKGSHNSDTEGELIDMRQNIVPILEEYGVDLVLCGHSHSYERSKFIDGHYGLSGTFSDATMVKQAGSGQEAGTGAYTKGALGQTPRSGAVYIVDGASGQISGGTLNHPAMFLSLNVLGSVVLDIDGGRLDFKYLDNLGAQRDSFTLIKGGAPGNVSPTVSLTSPANGATFTSPADITIAANAADSDGTVAKVDFYQGAALLGTDTTSPYSFAWNGVAAGSYSLTAVATDDLGATQTSSAVAITVTTPGGGPVTVSFQDGVNGYAGNFDTKMRSGNATTNYGTAATLELDGSPDDGSLIQWDLSSIPAGKTVTAVSIAFNVTNTSASTYELYALKRAWSEASATWNRATSTVNWEVAGANGANDRETAVLGAFNATAKGTKTVTLNTAGVATVQSWINTPSLNNGFVILDYTVSDGLDLASSETATISSRPKITITYQ